MVVVKPPFSKWIIVEVIPAVIVSHYVVPGAIVSLPV